MRLDKFLKNSRLIKRRTVANDACTNGRVKLNDKAAKPSAEVKSGDILEILFGEKGIKVRVLEISDHVAKKDASLLYEIVN
jgi:ribosomal 50S subunit-recycling heat shock protein